MYERPRTLHYAKGDSEALHWRIHVGNVKPVGEMTRG